jgi:hypothetical protein
MPADTYVTTPIKSTKGIISLTVIFTYSFMWAYAIYTVLGQLAVPEFNPMEFLLNFAGATGVMGMIVILVIQSYFRKSEAA